MGIRGFLKAALAAAGIALVSANPAAAQDNSELLQRLERLDAQVRTLTGIVEELNFRVEDLEQLVEILRADNEALYLLLAEAGIEVGAAAIVTNPAVADTPPANAPGNQTPALVQAPQTPGLAPGVAQGGGPLDLAGVLTPQGNFNLDANGAPIDPGVDVAAVDPAGQLAAPAGFANDPVADYNRGYQQVLNGDYVEAQQTFAAFLDAYPGNERTVDAHFWLAESLLSQGMYREAASEFYDAYVADPQHDKAPDMLMKLGISLAALGQTESACSAFEQTLQRYPDAPNALLQRVQAEQLNAGC